MENQEKKPNHIAGKKDCLGRLTEALNTPGTFFYVDNGEVEEPGAYLRGYEVGIVTKKGRKRFISYAEVMDSPGIYPEWRSEGYVEFRAGMARSIRSGYISSIKFEDKEEKAREEARQRYEPRPSGWWIW